MSVDVKNRCDATATHLPIRHIRPRSTDNQKPPISSHDAAKESNLPSRGLPGPAGFEDRMGHQAPAAPLTMVRTRAQSNARHRDQRTTGEVAEPPPQLPHSRCCADRLRRPWFLAKPPCCRPGQTPRCRPGQTPRCGSDHAIGGDSVNLVGLDRAHSSRSGVDEPRRAPELRAPRSAPGTPNHARPRRPV